MTYKLVCKNSVDQKTKPEVSGGSHSMVRFQETANLLSVIQTCRFQGRSFLKDTAAMMDFFPCSNG